jgi:hypothetical protein
VEGLLLIAALLACPVGMGLMMWFMMRGQKQPAANDSSSSLADLRAEQQRLDAAIADAEARKAQASGPRS